MKNWWNNKRLAAILFLLTGLYCIACDNPKADGSTPVDRIDTVDIIKADTAVHDTSQTITTLLPDSLVAFAKTQLGVPYLYASTDPSKGFDCSGFITYVFNHFNIKVPRSSVDFTIYGRDIGVDEAKPGDLILFTGTDSTIRVVGHMGIIESRQQDKLYFIHSTSG